MAKRLFNITMSDKGRIPFTACSEDEVVLTVLAIAYANLNTPEFTEEDSKHLEELVDNALCDTVPWGPKIEIKPDDGWHITMWSTVIP